MDASTLTELSSRALMLVLLLSLPAVLTAAFVGLVVALVQATTQLQDQSIGQALKLVAVLLVVAFSAKWVGHEILSFSDELFNGIRVHRR